MLNNDLIESFKKASKKIPKGKDRRSFQAEITNKYLKGSSRKAEEIFGWSRDTVRLGINELRSGIICVFSPKSGRKKTEEKYPKLEKDLEDLLKNEIQADTKLENTFKYLKISAKEVCKQLIEKKGYEKIPEKTMNVVLNRFGYNLKRIQKTKPLKKNKGSRGNIGKCP